MKKLTFPDGAKYVGEIKETKSIKAKINILLLLLRSATNFKKLYIILWKH